MTNDEARALLDDIRKRVLATYPLVNNNKIDPRYCIAFGFIGGMATEALDSVREDRNIHISPDLMHKVT